MSEDDSGTVIETREVEDLTSDADDSDEANELVDEAVDEMLDASDLEEDDEVRPEIQEAMDEAEEREPSQAESTEVSISGSPEEAVDDYDDFDFENQEWTLDERREPEVRDIRGTKFLFKEPENDDKVLNTLERASEGDRGDQMKAMVRLVVDKPDITDERWESMSFAAKLALSGQAADYLDLDEGFLEG